MRASNLFHTRLSKTGNVWRLNTIEHCLMTKHFTVWPPCLVVFDRVWSCFQKNWRPSNIPSNNLKLFFVLVFVGWCLFVWTAVLNRFGARMRSNLPQRLVSIVCSVFDPTYFNRLASDSLQHSHVWSPNNEYDDVWWCLAAKHLPFGHMLFNVSWDHSLKKLQLETKSVGTNKQKVTARRILPLCCSLASAEKLKNWNSKRQRV